MILHSQLTLLAHWRARSEERRVPAAVTALSTWLIAHCGAIKVCAILKREVTNTPVGLIFPSSLFLIWNTAVWTKVKNVKLTLMGLHGLSFNQIKADHCTQGNTKVLHMYSLAWLYILDSSVVASYGQSSKKNEKNNLFSPLFAALFLASCWKASLGPRHVCQSFPQINW